ncbi:hypothetical protein WS71_08560 [Burkholderia mayonis]|uniref:Uncharacterized protein n=1 Tax=Burkholderia mayonis TaxID=1385591 RepID=A0A1B4FUI2_9BURK|nr:hypothetical protein WS71_08560 [Burkholderia mayonis]KVE52044.1 hypothetical protein WS71_00305 [Burkholderia mayonis]
MVSRDALCRCFERIAGVRKLIRARDSKILNERRFHHVAEIEDPDHSIVLERIDHHVMSIEIVMDDLLAQ